MLLPPEMVLYCNLMHPMTLGVSCESTEMMILRVNAQGSLVTKVKIWRDQIRSQSHGNVLASHNSGKHIQIAEISG